jgi:hypothetical protein
MDSASVSRSCPSRKKNLFGYIKGEVEKQIHEQIELGE